MVGAGQLIKVLFGLEYTYAVIIVGVIMMMYVLFGGMTATTWVQIIKAVMLLCGATFMALAVLLQFGFSPEALFAKAVEVHSKHDAIMAPGALIKDPISAISVGMALMFGTAGLPHILQRFFTLPSAKEARKSVGWATTWIGYFYILTFIIGFGAIVNLTAAPETYYVGGELAKGLKGGGNMAAVHLANAVGGDLFLGFISAVAFSTILAVVLGIAFEKQNVAFMVMLAFAIACSANFPVLFMSVLWKNCTTKGAVTGGFVGLVLSVTLTVLSPAVWEATLGNAKGSAWFPYSSPAIFSMTAAFFTIWLVSILDNSEQAKKERALYPAQHTRSETGFGASTGGGH